MYERKTPIEHVLLRPGMYVGPTQKVQSIQPYVPYFVAGHPPRPSPASASPSLSPLPPPPTPATRLEPLMRFSRVPPSSSSSPSFSYPSYTPALSKIFDEILVNASDNLQRDPKNCTRVDVIIDAGDTRSSPPRPFSISVYNNGRGIPVSIHKKENLYVPELLFGHLLTGSNFDDGEAKTTGGRHGYGAKLANIFSSSFTVETCDSSTKKKYKQTWERNMGVAGAPAVLPMQAGEKDFTRITFVPDLQKLGIETVDDDDYKALCRRVVDVAGCNPKLTVTLNGVQVCNSSFKDYAELYVSSSPGGGDSSSVAATDDPTSPLASNPVVYCRVNNRWEVAVCTSPSFTNEHVSFVNSMATPRGGTHVALVTQQITKRLHDAIVKREPNLLVTQTLVKNALFVFVNCLIENPSFDSQMKECLATPPSAFGSSCELPEKFLRDIVNNTSILSTVLESARMKQQSSLKSKTASSRLKLLNIPKLDDALGAGTDASENCTLILTEGDSAKALAVAGLEVLGREHYGVFPLRGKFMNVRDVGAKSLSENLELTNLCSIIGLDFKKTYAESTKELRYGKVMLMTDQDNDGSHIKGLMMNFFWHFWPELLKKKPEFLTCFVTPLIKATKGKETKSFYSAPEFQEWKNGLKNPDEARLWRVKYYKGLGTSTAAEGKEYFKDFANHHKTYTWISDADGETLDMAFAKDRADERKEWILSTYDPTAIAGVREDGSSCDTVTYAEFVNKELIHFSNADNIRSIPAAVDGLKPSQRKVLYACFKRNLKAEIKVAQLAGYCAEHTAYHHGEMSLHATITNMAQDFVGSNNLPLLYPSGQFGTRLNGGKDSASPRYIFTKLMPHTRAIFPEVDDPLLTYGNDDGQQIEPLFFVPVIPLLLVNGSHGIGTGWATSIPTFNPKDIIRYLKMKLKGDGDVGFDNMLALKPWVKGFSGAIEPQGSGFVTRGLASVGEKSTVDITELPVGKWTSDYKEVLLKMREQGLIKSFQEFHSTSKVHFKVFMNSQTLTDAEKVGLHKYFKLESTMSVHNMNAFDVKGAIKRYESAEELIDEFYTIRMEVYKKRKELIERRAEYEAQVIRNKARFVTEVRAGVIDIISGKLSKPELVKVLHRQKFDTKDMLESIRSDMDKASVGQEGVAGDGEAETLKTSSKAVEAAKSFDYLLATPLANFTAEKISELNKEKDKLELQLKETKATSAKQMWIKDLEALEKML